MTMKAEKLVAISQFLSAFPKLFDYVYDEKEEVIVESGKLVELVRYENVKGLFMNGTLMTSSEETVFHFTIDTYKFEGTVKGLWEMGLGVEEERSFRLIRYDPDYKIFVVGFTPNPPYPFTESIAISVLNPTAEDIEVSWYVNFLQYTEELVAMLDEMMREGEEE